VSSLGFYALGTQVCSDDGLNTPWSKIYCLSSIIWLSASIPLTIQETAAVALRALSQWRKATSFWSLFERSGNEDLCMLRNGIGAFVMRMNEALYQLLYPTPDPSFEEGNWVIWLGFYAFGTKVGSDDSLNTPWSKIYCLLSGSPQASHSLSRRLPRSP